MHTRKCKYCGKEFETVFWNKIYCTSWCTQRARAQKPDKDGNVIKKCACCNKEFKVKLGRGTNAIKYCSDECRRKGPKPNHAKIFEAEKNARNSGLSYGYANAVQVRVVIPEEFRKRVKQNV